MSDSESSSESNPERARIAIRVSHELRKEARIRALKRGETLQELMHRALVTEMEVCEADEIAATQRKSAKRTATG